MAIDRSLRLHQAALADVCERWQVAELAVFGSAARGEATPDSDIDLLVTFLPNAELGIWDLVRLATEFEDVLRKQVDLVERGTIRNPYRKMSIERDLLVVYAA